MTELYDSEQLIEHSTDNKYCQFCWWLNFMNELKKLFCKFALD
jgi:hypothetical protein